MRDERSSISISNWLSSSMSSIISSSSKGWSRLFPSPAKESLFLNGATLAESSSSSRRLRRVTADRASSCWIPASFVVHRERSWMMMGTPFAEMRKFARACSERRWSACSFWARRAGSS